jgi:hypothetical protein
LQPLALIAAHLKVWHLQPSMYSITGVGS